MLNARRFALIVFVMGVLGLSIGLTTQPVATSNGAEIAAAAPDASVTSDPFLGQGEFDTTGGRVTCIACLSIPCTEPGGPASCLGHEERGDPTSWSGCKCRTCNGQYNCWKS